MFSIHNLGQHYGGQTLFTGATFQFNAGSRYGLVGANGSGKSTMLRIISGREEPSEGSVSIPGRARVGTLKQDHFAYEDVHILDVVLMGIPELYEAMHAKEILLANSHEHFDADHYSELEDVILRLNGYTIEADAARILEGLNIPERLHRQPMSVLSGGYKLRVLLAQTLASEPDILFLDEPTNHLDIISIRWLEKFLCDFNGCVVVVSHDRQFLNRVCTHIVDIDYQRATMYTGDYDHYELAKVEDADRRDAEIEKREAEIEDHKQFIDRFKAKATKARQAASKKKRMEKIVIERLAPSSRQYPRFNLSSIRPSGRLVLEAEHISKSYGENHVLKNVSLKVEKGDRLAIIGPNGIGKSTLLNIFVGKLPPDLGKVEWGYETRVGYFEQDHAALSNSERETLQDWLYTFVPEQTIGYIRHKLAEVLFSQDDANKRVSALSGGESARMVFAMLSVTQPNVLVLDEPTNHLDIEGIEALSTALQAYDGTIVFVSHNRWFVSELANRIIEIHETGLNDFRGTYAEYIERLGDDHLDSEAAWKRAKTRR